MEIFFLRLIHIQSSQNVNHKRSPIRCIKDQCQSAGKGQRTNRRDQLPQLCVLPNWEHVILMSLGAQCEPVTCSSSRPTSLCPLQCHSKCIQESSTSVCTEISVHSPLRVMTIESINVNDRIPSLKYLHLSMGHMGSVGYMPLANQT